MEALELYTPPSLDIVTWHSELCHCETHLKKLSFMEESIWGNSQLTETSRVCHRSSTSATADNSSSRHQRQHESSSESKPSHLVLNRSGDKILAFGVFLRGYSEFGCLLQHITRDLGHSWQTLQPTIIVQAVRAFKAREVHDRLPDRHQTHLRPTDLDWKSCSWKNEDFCRFTRSWQRLWTTHNKHWRRSGFASKSHTWRTVSPTP